MADRRNKVGPEGSLDGRSGGGRDERRRDSAGTREPPPYNVGNAPHSFRRPIPDEGPQRQPSNPRRIAPGPSAQMPASQVPLASQAPPGTGIVETPAPSPYPELSVPRRPGKRREDEFQDPAYLYTEDYPFTYAQIDVDEEKGLGGSISHHDQAILPQMTGAHQSGKLLSEKGPTSEVENLDKTCAEKHLGAISGSKMTLKTLHRYILMEGEDPEETLDLAGLENAPGVHDEMTQCCRLVFTNKKRLVFTQAKHSAEVGMPRMFGLMSFIPCFHDGWSSRKWSSYYAVINAPEVIQVFVQQTLVTNYQNTKCSFNGILDTICCASGGTLYSEKNIHGATQTLGDYDPKGCMSEYDHSRYMRHALVIRYLDGASNQILQTVAYAHPKTPAANLFEMARSIEANITTRPADLLKNKLPTALLPVAFQNTPPQPPITDTGSYRLTIFIAFVVALIFFAINTAGAVIMIFAVLLSVGGSLAIGNAQRKLTPNSRSSWLPAALKKFGGNVTFVVSSGASLVIYVSAAYTSYQAWQIERTVDAAF